MKKFEYETRERTVKEKFLKANYIVCDICGKRIDVDHYYFDVTTGHNDWGNDSVDSIEHKHVCDDCIDKVFDEYKEAAFYKGGRNTDYLSVSRNRVYRESEPHIDKSTAQIYIERDTNIDGSIYG